MIDLAEILKSEFPKLKVMGTSCNPIFCSKVDLTNIVCYIRSGKLIEDAMHVLSETNPGRRAVIYNIEYANQPKPLTFEVLRLPGMIGEYTGTIYANDQQGTITQEAKLIGMQLR